MNTPINKQTSQPVLPPDFSRLVMRPTVMALFILVLIVAFGLRAMAQSAGDYRTVSNNNWTNPVVWETYNGTSWGPAVTAPTATSVGVITIRNGYSVTNTTSITVDQVVIEGGGMLVASNNFTAANGTGTDLDIYGTFLAYGGSSCLTIASGANVVVESGGVLIHNGSATACVNNTAGTLQIASGGKFTLIRSGGGIPTATWDSGSVCEVAYIADGTKPSTAALVQNFADFTVNCPLQASGWDFAGNLTNHVGKFTVTMGANPGATELKLFSGSSSTGNLNIGGDFTINSGSINVASSGGPWSLTASSNITVAAGADFNLSGSASATYSMILNGTGMQNYTCNGTNRATKLNWTVNSGSTLNLNSDLPLSTVNRTLTANGTVNLNGKTILADLIAGTGTVRNEGGGSGKLIIGTGGGTNTIPATLSLLDGSSGTLGIVKSGGGLLTIANAQTFSGGLVVSNGTVFVNNTSGSGTGSGAVTVAGGTLAGTGIISGAANVQAGGNLAPGNGGLGTLTINNTLSLAGNATIEVTKGTGQDQVTASTVNYGGTLTVVTNGNPFIAGDTFQIFNAGSFSGNFGTISGSPGANMAWSFNPTNGVLSVVNTAVTPPTLSFSPSGNSLSLSWTDAGYKLQSQTNDLTVGLGTNWVDYPGGNTSPVNANIDSSNGSVFFRLAPAP